jgi:hypothetical protein
VGADYAILGRFPQKRFWSACSQFEKGDNLDADRQPASYKSVPCGRGGRSGRILSTADAGYLLDRRDMPVANQVFGDTIESIRDLSGQSTICR